MYKKIKLFSAIGSMLLLASCAFNSNYQYKNINPSNKNAYFVTYDNESLNNDLGIIGDLKHHLSSKGWKVYTTTPLLNYNKNVKNNGYTIFVSYDDFNNMNTLGYHIFNHIPNYSVSIFDNSNSEEVLSIQGLDSKEGALDYIKKQIDSDTYNN